MAARFEAFGIPYSVGTATEYRRVMYRSADLGKFVSGAILTEECLYDAECVEALSASSIICGVRADRKTAPLPGARQGETWTTGADTLLERAEAYRAAGAKFAKWRARFRVNANDGAPSALAVKENCWTMARSARTLQEVGLVPMLEPAILHDGDHAIDRAAELSERLYVEVFRAMSENGVNLECLLLSPTMTLPGADNADEINAELVAAYSVRTLERTVPSAVPGCAFASAGLPEEDASLCLDAINRIERKGPWSLLAGFSRSTQMSCFMAWAKQFQQEEDHAGDEDKDHDKANAAAENGDKAAAQKHALDAQALLVGRAKANAAANLGQYAPSSAPSLDQTPSLKGWATR
mmetsp:Transcript_13911/g.45402  ORF Transcript_13911/g.45402 Transcript_13911/m.45402 type:complete len:352 (+) Transcript_13911:349-1404(+)